MTVSPGDIVRLAVRMTGPQGQDIMNVYHVQHAGGVGVSDAAFLTAMETWIDTMYSRLNTVIEATQEPLDIKVDVVEFSGGLWQIVRNIATIGWGGIFNSSASGDNYAPGVACLVLLRTLVGKVLGRKFIGTLAEAVLQDNGEPIAAAITALTNYANDILTGFTVAAQDFVSGVPSSKLGIFAEFVEAQVSKEAAYQRRRAVRQGS
jgi:hypothetical protein